jgi:hypothetical protein
MICNSEYNEESRSWMVKIINPLIVMLSRSNKEFSVYGVKHLVSRPFKN